MMTLGKGRFESFSDGVFAIAITLLILEIHLPSSVSPASSSWEQAAALLQIWPEYLVYAASFATVGIMWLNHHALFDDVRVITHGVAVANLVLLGLISFLPFTTEVFARMGLTPTAVVFYGITLTAIALGYLGVRWQVIAAHPGSGHALTRWSVVGMTAYPLATVIGIFVPLLGVILIGLLALFYALPRNVRTARVMPAAGTSQARR